MDFEDSEAMKSNLLVSLFKQAIKTFSPKSVSSSEFSSSFQQLKSSLDKVRAADVRLDPSFDNDAFWERHEKAPCTYIEIFENQNFNMSIFVLKPGFKMPLHDHPQMHGLLKVISGKIRIKSFSKLKPEDTRTSAAHESLEMNRKSFLAEISTFKVCDANTESCVLTPDDSNFHEIEALNGPSAFLDILAPPYTTYIRDNRARECHYYKILQEISSDLVQLEEIPSPRWFYCDQAPYLGPVLI